MHERGVSEYNSRCCCNSIEQIGTMIHHNRRSVLAATLAAPVLVVLLLWCLSTIPSTNATTTTPSAQPSTSSSSSSSSQAVKKQQRGLCVIGCTPYVDPSQPNHGIQKYWKLVQEMADTCQIIAHVGDTKPGTIRVCVKKGLAKRNTECCCSCCCFLSLYQCLRFSLNAAALTLRQTSGRMPCTEDIVTASVRYMVDQGNRTGALVLYAPGDNELSDCYQHAASAVPSSTLSPMDIVRAADAREFIIQDLRLNSGQDLTGNFAVVNHDMSDRMNRATCDENGNNCKPYSCDFDKYVEVDNYAIATLEVIGSHWYLDVSYCLLICLLLVRLCSLPIELPLVRANSRRFTRVFLFFTSG
jgi:hypothetical protein